MRLFEPINIKNMKLKNRIIMPAIHVNLGITNRRVKRYFVERAKGGAAALTIPAVTVDLFVDDQAWLWEGLPAGSCARFREKLKDLTNGVQEAGAKIGMQLWHGNMFPCGMWGGYGMGADKITGDRVGPSDFGERRALTLWEIEAIVEKFAIAVLACKEAGFDFIDFNGAHGYLMNQFFSPALNHREDKYGGSLRRRMQFALDCVTESRKLAGDDYPFFFRMGAINDKPGGITVEQSVAFAVELEKAGIDVIGPSTAEVTPLFAPISHMPVGTFVNCSEAIKKRVKIPIMGVGRIHTPELAEAYLAQNKLDLVGIGRQLIADPYYPQKVASGRFDEVKTCLSCNMCLDSTMYDHKELCCSVNSAVAKEDDHLVTKAETPRKVFIIGSGPAGMEAAITAAKRGHKVTLFEKQKDLGGQLITAAVPPGKWELERFRQHMINIMVAAGVKIRKGRLVSATTIIGEKPDSVIIATGVVPFLPSIPGIKRRNVVSANDVLSGKVEVGKRVAIIGGELIGCETADYLAAKGKKVTVLRRGKEVAVDVGPSQRGPLLERLQKSGVVFLTEVKYEEITSKGLVITDNKGEKQVIRADSIVIAAGSKSNNALENELKGKVPSVYSIGDCVEPRKIVNAIVEGEKVGREI